MKKFIIIVTFILATLVTTCAFAQETMTVTTYHKDGTITRRSAELYLRTYEVQQGCKEICRENGDDYENSAEPKPLRIAVKDDCYVVYFRTGDPSDCSRWSARYFEANEVIIRLEETLDPQIQKVSVSESYRYCDTKVDIGNPHVRTKYLLTLPEDTIFEHE